MRTVLLVLLLVLLSTPALAACPGDCDGNDAVGAAEIDQGVEILLGRAALGTCGAADADASGEVTCRDLVRAVGSLVGGCPGGNAVISGRVADVDGGGALFGVTARLGTRTASTDSNGIFQFAGVPAGSAVVQFSRDGYAPTAETFSAATDAAPHAVFMKAVTGKFSFAGSAGGEFQAGGSVLRVEASSLRDGSGNPVTGEVALEITKFDAAGPDINAFPGEFQGTTAGGQPTAIESFGFATYSLTSGGRPVDLAPGATAEIEFLIADADQGKFTVGQQVGLWGYDEATGRWAEEPVAGTIRASSQQAGKLAWVADVPHFSTWNCDRPITEKHCLRGRVERDGRPVAGAQVSAAGVTYNGVSETTSASDGTFCLDVKRGESVRVEARINGAPLPLAVQDVAVPATEGSCATAGCTTLPAPLTVSFDACVSGVVRDAQGAPAAGLTVHVIPGETVTTGADGRYCSSAPSNAEVTVMAAGFLSALVTTPDAAACDAGCAPADLTTLLPGEGFTIATASVSYSRSLASTFGPTGPIVQSSESLSASGDFLVIGFTGQQQGDTTVTIDDVGGCRVVMTVTVFSGEPTPPTYTVLPLDPGNPGEMSSGALVVDLLRGDPASVDPPNPFLLGTFGPAEGTDLLALGFGPDRQYGFSWPGGSDIGAFSGSVGLAPAIVVSSPNLSDPSLSLVPGVPYATTWTPSGDANDEMVVSLTTVTQAFDPQAQSFTSTSVTVTCEFPDSAGTGTISAQATSRLLVGYQSGSIGYGRSRRTDVQAPLLRTGGTTTVQLHGQASLERTMIGGI